MVSMETFIRSTPATTLRAYFQQIGIAPPHAVDWSAPPPDIAGSLMNAVGQSNEFSRARVLNDAERVGAMADEAGQTALYGVVQRREILDALENRYDRALWMFLNEPDAFRHAEDARFTDEHRRGRMWDGFIGLPGLTVRRGPEMLDRFKAAIRERFDAKNVHVDIFNRHRPSSNGENYQLIQTTVYRDGHLDDFLEFVNGMLGRRPRRPVYEAALTYEASTGVIEVVANNRENREDFVRLFARELLGSEFKQERLPLRRYDLGILLRPFEFPSDPEDGIESVHVNELRLMPMDTVGERVTLECSRQAPQTIWRMASDRFGSTNPLLGGWIITKARLTIRFHSERDSRRGRSLPLTVTMPHGCDLKERTERERIIGEKYLRRWHLVQDV